MPETDEMSDPTELLGDEVDPLATLKDVWIVIGVDFLVTEVTRE